MAFAETSVTDQGRQPYKYEAKELDPMHGLNAYDSYARMYFPDIVRTPTPDPLAEKYYSVSPYVWCLNNPINFTDPTGMSACHPLYQASSFVSSDGTLIEHRNDGDPRVYLVQDIGAWIKDGRKKEDAEHVGYEYPGTDYSRMVGNSIYYYPSKSPFMPGHLKDGPIEVDYTIESFFIPVFSWLKYLKFAKFGSKIPWGFWSDMVKITYKGNTYAKIGKRIYTRHAIERMIPSGFGKAAGGVYGRSISPNIVEEVIKSGSKITHVVDGVVRTEHILGSVHVITENMEKIVVTVITK